ncbi:unnamed protein product [Paramecium sonneborni]|uniref:Uncharacterized protein n=1 Tax=Paramecium sonneborni TaxID=65129 RepID=A0A8S1N908_9CILI|nr:unnamed protein product [Paramecium sonneborni]
MIILSNCLLFLHCPQNKKLNKKANYQCGNRNSKQKKKSLQIKDAIIKFQIILKQIIEMLKNLLQVLRQLLQSI